MVDLAKKLGTAAATFAICLIGAELFVRSCVPVRNVGPSFATYDARYGKALKPSISVTRYTPEFEMRFTTNSLGFRGPEVSSLEAGSILFLGDSFTMGYGVTDGKEYPALIREAIASDPSFDGVQVINTGMGDNGNGRPLIFLKSDASRLNPKLIVLQIQDNDFYDNVREQLFEVDDSGELERRPIPERSAARHLQRVIEWIPGLPYSHLVGLSRQLRLAAATIPTDDELDAANASNSASEAAEDELFFALMDAIVDVVEERGWPLLVVLADIQNAPRLAMLQEFFDARGVQSLALPTKPERPDLYFRVDGHWNEAGQAHAANVVLTALREIEL